MSNPTSNFGWQMPTATDLVTDLPADFEVFGQAVDSSMADLKGGTTGQILAKNTNTDMDFVWVTNDVGDITAVTAGTGITGGGTSGAVTITNDMATTITASGDIVVGTGSGTYDNLPIGTTGQILTADTTVSPYKVKWATASPAAYTKVKSASFSAVTDTSTTFNSVFNTTYSNYVIVMNVKGTIGANLYFRGTNGATIRTSNYQASNYSLGANGTFYTVTSSAAAQASLATLYSIYANTVSITISNVGTGSASVPTWAGTFMSIANNNNGFTGGLVDNGAVDGFILSASSGTITGDVYVYGLGV